MHRIEQKCWTIFSALFFAVIYFSPADAGQCTRFHDSTMEAGGAPEARWRTDYPPQLSAVSAPWLDVDYAKEPAEYMAKIVESAKPYFRRDGNKLVGTGSEPWWISLWMDSGRSGRERSMGLTKERGPDPGDIAEGSVSGPQVWAVGFYNAPGAFILGEVFADPCDPKLPSAIRFPRGTASIKFLFIDVDSSVLEYLAGAPPYEAYIDAAGSGKQSKPVASRLSRAVRLLQVDVSARDERAPTGWVFGTFAWIGPATGDNLFDNLAPVSLQWGNDPQVYDRSVQQSWVNPALKGEGKLYGWSSRPTLGYNGRANGPADNIRSSCLSCHGSARIPSVGNLDTEFDWKTDRVVRITEHVDMWFQNIPAGGLFFPRVPATSALDYSLQIQTAISRLCSACNLGEMSGQTPTVCLAANLSTAPQCAAQRPLLKAVPLDSQPEVVDLDADVPRQ